MIGIIQKYDNHTFHCVRNDSNKEKQNSVGHLRVITTAEMTLSSQLVICQQLLSAYRLT